MRTVDEIYQNLLTSFKERSGYGAEDSCDLAVRLFAVAAQIQALECQAEWVLDQSFPQTAQGTCLDNHAALRGITRQEATFAKGMLRFSASDVSVNDLLIPKGTVCMTEDENRFLTTQAAIMKAGDVTVDVPAQAMEPGRRGNAAAGSITIMTACPIGITACKNPTAFTGGTDAESDDALRCRVLESYQRLPNGANAAFYEEQALRHNGVAAATAVGRARGIGTVDVYIAAASGIPDSALIEAVKKDLQNKREIAVDVHVCAPKLNNVDISIELKTKDHAEFIEIRKRVEAEITGWFTGKLLGKPVLLAELGRRIFTVEGVENYHILTPRADVAENSTMLPTLGTLTVTEMGK